MGRLDLLTDGLRSLLFVVQDRLPRPPAYLISGILGAQLSSGIQGRPAQLMSKLMSKPTAAERSKLTIPHPADQSSSNGFSLSGGKSKSEYG